MDFTREKDLCRKNLPSYLLFIHYTIPIKIMSIELFGARKDIESCHCLQRSNDTLNKWKERQDKLIFPYKVGNLSWGWPEGSLLIATT